VTHARIAAALFVAVILVAPGGAARAADPEDVAARVSQRIMSPFCPGVTLHDCPSREADELRRRIEEWAAAGASESEIVDRLHDKYGDVIRATPPAEGSGLLAWILPVLAVLSAVAVAITVSRRLSQRGASREPMLPPTPQERRRLALELRAFRDENDALRSAQELHPAGSGLDEARKPS
jgi:cytochrome c-type biogenesis protein CcmH/NrfF